MPDVALEVPLCPLAFRRGGQCDDPDEARVQECRHPLDDASLAGSVAAFEKDDDAEATVPNPLFELEHLDLESPQLLLVVLLSQRRRARRPRGRLLVFGLLGGCHLDRNVSIPDPGWAAHRTIGLVDPRGFEPLTS